MAIEFLEITNFRNLRHVCLEPSPRLNLVIGKNGSGKTSLLESLYFLGTARSFRTPHNKKLISLGEQQFSLFAKVRHKDRSQAVGIIRDQTQAKIKIAGHLVKSASQLADILAVQLINPDAHKLLEEGPRFRRRFIEWGVFHVEPKYFPAWQQCRVVLKQRNAALKMRVSTRELKHWDETLCKITSVVDSFRQNYLAKLVPHINTLLASVPGLPIITLSLVHGWPKDCSLAEALAAAADSDKEKGFTQYGPHRADLRIKADGLKAKELISRGQQKLITALFKIAQLRLLNEHRPECSSLLLLDDLPAELDATYREVLMDIVGDLNNTQSYVTATEHNFIDPLVNGTEGARVFHVEHGSIA